MTTRRSKMLKLARVARRRGRKRARRKALLAARRPGSWWWERLQRKLSGRNPKPFGLERPVPWAKMIGSKRSLIG